MDVTAIPMNMDINKRLESIKDYIKENSNVNTGVDLKLAEASGLQIVNSETPSEEIELFSNPNNSTIALAWLDA